MSSILANANTNNHDYIENILARTEASLGSGTTGTAELIHLLEGTSPSWTGSGNGNIHEFTGAKETIETNA